MSNENQPSCLGYTLGIKSYPVICGLFHQPWHKDPFSRNLYDSWKVSCRFFFRFAEMFLVSGKVARFRDRSETQLPKWWTTQRQQGEKRHVPPENLGFWPPPFFGCKLCKEHLFSYHWKANVFFIQDDFVSIFEYGTSGEIIYSFLRRGPYWPSLSCFLQCWGRARCLTIYPPWKLTWPTGTSRFFIPGYVFIFIHGGIFQQSSR